MERWVGQVAIVTGASSGIGADVAKKLVQLGLKVVGLARRVERIEELSKTLEKESGKLYAVKCDMTKESDIKNAFKWTTENVGNVHILINNAGVLQNTSLIDGDAEKWRRVFEVNVMGLNIATREAILIMRKNKIDGHIIHINSVAGHRVIYFPNINVYPASKFAVTALTESLRVEIKANNLKIKVTSVSPGAVQTEIATAGDFTYSKELIDKMKDIKILDPSDVTEACIYALSTKPHVQIHEITLQPLDELH